IECPRSEQLLGRVSEILGSHIVDIRLDDNDGSHRRLNGKCAFFTKHQPQTVRKVGKLLCTGAIADLLRSEPAQTLKTVDYRGQNCSSCRGHEFGLDMFLIDRRMPQQIRGRRSWNGENAVLAVNKAAADVDRGAEKTFDAKRVEADSCA